jgi:hypothetical protein
VFYARVAQSLIHLLGVSALLVLGRATFWFVQVGLFIYMFWSLLA